MSHYLIIGSLLILAPGVFSNFFMAPKLLLLAAGCAIMEQPARAKMDRYALPFLAIYAISTVFSVDPWVSIFGQFRMPLNGLVEIVLVYLIYRGATAIRHKNIPLIVTWAGVIMAAWAIAQVFIPVLAPFHLPGGRAISTSGSPIFLGACLVVAFLCAESLPYGWSMVGSAVIVGGMIAARSKGALFAAAAGFCALQYAKQNISKRTVTLILTVMLAAQIGYLFMSKAPGDKMRIIMDRISVQAWTDHPWLGWGPDNYLLAFRKYRGEDFIALGSFPQAQAEAHNDWLQVLTTTGLAGVLTYVWLVYGLLSTVNGLAFAIVVALMFQAQVNPIAIEALGVAALIVGGAE